MTDERPIPWSENERAQRVLARLQQGPASTIELQDELSMVHVARQIYELRTWYGWLIETKRLPNRVALYVLLGRCIFPGCVSTDRHWHGGFPGGYDNPEDPNGMPILFTTEPTPGVRDYNGALLPATRPSFGDPELIREMRRPARRNVGLRL